jgi:hypothetical protein
MGAPGYYPSSRCSKSNRITRPEVEGLPESLLPYAAPFTSSRPLDKSGHLGEWLSALGRITPDREKWSADSSPTLDALVFTDVLP